MIHTDTGKDFVVEAPANTEHSVYWKSAMLNKDELKTTYITHEAIKNGGTLSFEMSCYPEESHYDDSQLPYSVSKDEI